MNINKSAKLSKKSKGKIEVPSGAFSVASRRNLGTSVSAEGLDAGEGGTVSPPKRVNSKLVSLFFLFPLSHFRI